MSTKILCVDDDANILAGFQRNLRKQFSLDTAVGGEEGLKAIEANGPYAVVVADMQMPGMSGIQFLAKVEECARDTVRIMLTGNADQKTAMDAVNEGHVFRFLNKPCTPESLAVTLEAALGQYRLVTAERDLLENTLSGCIRALTEILSKVNPKMAASSEALRDQIRQLAGKLQVHEPWEIEVASMLANVGYVTLSPSIMLKSTVGLPLSEAEKGSIARIPEVSSNLVLKIPRMQNVAQIIRNMRKNFDGSGFPPGAGGDQDIPIGSRILRVLTDLSEHERNGDSYREALGKMKQVVGVYDPQVLEAANSVFAHQPRPARRPAITDLPGSHSGPAKLEEAGEQGVNSNGPAKIKRFDDPLNVLVVDDKPTINEQICGGLKDTAWVVTACTHSSDALKFCKQTVPDVILVSVSLPDKKGFHLFESLRANPGTKYVPIFAMCVKTAVENQASAHQFGFNSIVTKPIDMEELKSKISRALNLDQSYKYFEQRDGVLRLRLPPDCSLTVSNEVTLHLRSQFTAAVDAGIDKVILDFSQVQSADISTIKLGLEARSLCIEMALKNKAVASAAFEGECQNYEETKSWQFMGSLQEALAEFKAA